MYGDDEMRKQGREQCNYDHFDEVEWRARHEQMRKLTLVSSCVYPQDSREALRREFVRIFRQFCTLKHTDVSRVPS